MAKKKNKFNAYWNDYKNKFAGKKKVKSKYIDLQNELREPKHGEVKVVKWESGTNPECLVNDYYFLNGLPLIPNSDFKSYTHYCKSDYFINLKSEVLRLAKFKCKKCKKGAITAHHKRYRKNWTETKLEDCIAICYRCHGKIHHNKKD